MDIEQISEGYLARGCCCTEAIVRAGLDWLGCENEQLAGVSSALCCGLHAGLTCGALSGGAILLSLFDRKLAAEALIPQLVEWFDAEYGMQYGSSSCEDIAGERLQHRAVRCKPLVLAVGVKCASLLQENGLLQTKVRNDTCTLLL